MGVGHYEGFEVCFGFDLWEGKINRGFEIENMRFFYAILTRRAMGFVKLDEMIDRYQR